MNFKKSLMLCIGGTLLCLGYPIVSKAETPICSNIPSSAPLEQDNNINNRTAIITAKGHLEGAITPYIEGLPFTGNVSLHYSATNSGFVDGDVSVITVKLPDEFKYVASVPQFKEKITGNLHIQTVFGQKTVPINQDMIDSYPDRLLITVPSSFWIGIGQTSADITINYGEFLEQYPKLTIPDAPNGYTFITQLQYSSAMWDLIKNPIIGTDTDTYTSKETSAIVQ